MPSPAQPPPRLDPAEVSSLATSLEDLTRRITALADRFSASAREDAAAATLYEVERHLRSATRRLASLR